VVKLPGGALARADETLELAQGRSEVRACGDRLNGPRLYAWSMIATASPEHFLMIRQAVDDDEPDPGSKNREISSQNWFHALSCPENLSDRSELLEPAVDDRAPMAG
jgi:hypothetical protein